MAMSIFLTYQKRASGLFRQWFMAAAALGLVLAVGARATAATAAEGRYTIVTTTGMIADIARNVAGDRADVAALMKEGTDPHLYTPTRSDVVQLMRADVIFYNGLLLEGKMSDVLGRMEQSDKPVVAMAEKIEASYLVSDPSTNHFDPHVWMDVQGWLHAVDAVEETLTSYDSAAAEMYRRNAQQYRSMLRQLDDYARSTIATIPEQQRVLITAHDAFEYFGRAYDIDVHGIQGISTESEAGVRDINELVNFIVSRRIKAVFVETSVADKYVRALIEGARAQGHEVRIGGSLYSDAMGSAGTWEGTYPGMIDHNVTTIANALGGSAPTGGFRAWRSEREAATKPGATTTQRDGGDDAS